MVRNFKGLQAKIALKRRIRVEQRVAKALREMALEEVRTTRHLTQQELAKILHVDQGSISKLERRADMYISTLRSYIEAMGGELRIRASFPDGEVVINQSEELTDENHPDSLGAA